MDIKKQLSKAITSRFKANLIVEQLEKIICKNVETKTYAKYYSKTHHEDGYVFNLIGVRTRFCVYGFTIPEVMILLDIVVSEDSKIPKVKRERIKKLKSEYSNNRHFDHCYYKVKLWKTLTYEISLEKALSGEFILDYSKPIKFSSES